MVAIASREPYRLLLGFSVLLVGIRLAYEILIIDEKRQKAWVMENVISLGGSFPGALSLDA